MKKEIKVVTITPEYAADLLKMNINNRTVRPKKVAQLAEQMRKGEWELSNDAITISEGNILLNGQHRLMAVVQSGVPCDFILYTGAPDQAFDVMDTPSLRRVADVISRKGGKSCMKLESSIGRYMNLHNDHLNEWETMYRFANDIQATRREMVNYFEEHGEFALKWVNRVQNVSLRGVRLLSEAQLAGFAMFLEQDMFHSEEKIHEFIKELLIDGMTQHKTILAVRKKLMRHKVKMEILTRSDVMRYLIRAWNDYVTDKEVSCINAKEDSFYFIRPL